MPVVSLIPSWWISFWSSLGVEGGVRVFSTQNSGLFFLWRRKGSFWTLLFFSLFLVPLPVFSSEVIHISSGPWAPYSGEDLPEYGFVCHVITEAFARVGVQVQFSFMPWVRAYQLMLTGHYDASAFWYRSKEREKYCYYSHPVNREQMVFFYQGEDPVGSWEELADLAGFRIGATRGLTYTDEFWELAHKGTLQVLVTDSEYNSFSQLIRGRIDLFISNQVAGKELLRARFPEEVIWDIGYTEQVVSEVTGHLLFPRGREGSQELLAVFNQGLAEIKEDGTYDLLYQNLLIEGYSK